MGASYSKTHTNLHIGCTDFEANTTGTTARWGASYQVSFSTRDDDNKDVWAVEYKRGMGQTCGILLEATLDDNNGVKSINLGLHDSSPENEVDISVEITRTRRYGLHEGGINFRDSNGISISRRYGLRGGDKNDRSSNGKTSMTTLTRDEDNHSVHTTTVQYGFKYRRGLFVLETRKCFNCEDAFMVTLAHYYVTQERGLSVTATIHLNLGNIFDVELDGPFKHPSADLLKVFDTVSLTSVWSSAACSCCHCRGAKESVIITKTRNYNQYSYNIITASKVNSGANSGDGDSSRIYDNRGGKSITNSGIFTGNKGDIGNIGRCFVNALKEAYQDFLGS